MCGTKARLFEVVRSASGDGDWGVELRQDRLKWLEVPQGMGIGV